MPAMSPTMKEGGISSWKVQEGAAFSAGDVLLEIVRAPPRACANSGRRADGCGSLCVCAGDGQGDDRRRGAGGRRAGEDHRACPPAPRVHATQLTPGVDPQLNDGAKNVPVGQVIALLAEEGDDISNLEAPKDAAPPPAPESPAAPPTTDAKSAPSSSEASAPPQAHSGAHPTHARPLFPSVLRLLQEHGVADTAKITGTGVRGMLTKGDVLAFLGKASSPQGSCKSNSKVQDGPVPKAGGAPGAAKPAPKVCCALMIRMYLLTDELLSAQPLDGQAIRMLIVNNLLNASKIQPGTPFPSLPTVHASHFAARDILCSTTSGGRLRLDPRRLPPAQARGAQGHDDCRARADFKSGHVGLFRRALLIPRWSLYIYALELTVSDECCPHIHRPRYAPSPNLMSTLAGPACPPSHPLLASTTVPL